MLKHRVMAALVFVPVILGSVYVGGLILYALFAGISLIMFWEYQRMMTLKRIAWLGYACVLLAYISPCIRDMYNDLYASLIWILISLLVLSSMLLPPVDTKTSPRDSALMLMGVIYCGGLMPYFALLRDRYHDGLATASMVLLCVWLSDTAAYFVGRAWGRHKLAPSISPGKTWEGAIAGCVASCTVVAIFLGQGWLFLPDVSLIHALWIGNILGISGIVGDLCESLLKRSYGVKDSSNLLPGHGGFLDRFDSLIFSAPVLYCIMTVFG